MINRWRRSWNYNGLEENTALIQATLFPLHFPEFSMRTAEITRQPVELFKILKFEGMVTTGGEAKLVIADGQVSVNGEIETRKRRKILDGDVIVFANESLQIRLA